MATREAPPPGLLEGFSAPLWERLRLDRLRPLSIVRGQHRGHDWMAIDLEHGSTGLFSTGAPSTDTTTVFVVRLPRKSSGWYLPDDRITATQQVCVDDGHVYAAALGQRPRVRDWRRWLDTAIDAAEEVVRTEGQRPAADSTQSARHWNPHDRRWVLVWAVLTVPLAFMVLAVLMDAFQEWRSLGAIVWCDSSTHLGSTLRGWKAAACFGLLLLPLAGLLQLARTSALHIHTPGFALRLNLQGVALASVSLLVLYALQALMASARGPC